MTGILMGVAAIYATIVLGYVGVVMHEDNGADHGPWLWTALYALAILIVFAGGYWLRGAL